jgi:4-amino-4-deoxy-L-arabinose transferase-like glycosyltransferase
VCWTRVLQARAEEAELRAYRLVVAGLVLAVVLLRVGLVLAVTTADPDRSVVNDTPSYAEPARALVHDGDFDRSPGSDAPEFIRTPGYPAFVAAVYWVSGESDTAVFVVQAIISGLSVLLVIALARRLTGSIAVGLAAGVLLAVDPVQATASGYILTETLATVLVTLAAYCGVRLVQAGWSVRWALAYAAAVTAATYVRPTTYYFPLVATALLLVVAVLRRADRRMVVRAAVAIAVPCVVLLGAWNVRNHVEVDSWRFSAIEGKNVYFYRAAGIVAARDGIGLDEARLRLTEDLYRGREPAFDYGRYRNGDLPPEWEDRQGEYYDRARQAGVEILRSEPVLTARQVARGLYSQVLQSGWASAYWYGTGRSAPAPVQGVGLVAVWGVEALAVVGAAASLRRRSTERLAHVLTLALPLYAAVVAAGPEAAAGYRFRAPFWPIFCFYAAIGLRYVAILVRDRTRIGRPARAPAVTAPTTATTTPTATAIAIS